MAYVVTAHGRCSSSCSYYTLRSRCLLRSVCCGLGRFSIMPLCGLWRRFTTSTRGGGPLQQYLEATCIRAPAFASDLLMRTCGSFLPRPNYGLHGYISDHLSICPCSFRFENVVRTQTWIGVEISSYGLHSLWQWSK